MSDKRLFDTRKLSRDSLLIGTALKVDGLRNPVSVRVRNLSSKGMKVEGQAVLPEGARVSAELRGIGEVEGTVGWSKPGQAGIVFDAEIDPRAARTINAPTGNRPPIYPREPNYYGRRPGLRSAD